MYIYIYIHTNTYIIVFVNIKKLLYTIGDTLTHSHTSVSFVNYTSREAARSPTWVGTLNQIQESSIHAD